MGGVENRGRRPRFSIPPKDLANVNALNQSTESADGGGFLNFYMPLDYISSVLSFCSIFLDM